MAKTANLSTLSFAELIKAYYTVRDSRLSLDRESAKLKVQEDKLAYALASNWKPDEVPDGFVATREDKKVPSVNNWPDFLEWARDNDALDCLQKRLTNSAVQLRLDAGIEMPGVELVDKTVITVEKSDDQS